MNKLTADKCREQFEEWFMKTYPKSRNGIRTWSGKKDGDYVSDYASSHWRAWQASREALEIALPILEQQESDGDIFIVMRNPGKVPDIKRPVGDVADYLLQLYQHNPDAVCDAVTYRFSGVSGQWVQDGRELLAMAGVVLEQQEKGNDGWIVWHGGRSPVDDSWEIAVKLRDGVVMTETHSNSWIWSHSGDDDDIIAYRVIENDGREG